MKKPLIKAKTIKYKMIEIQKYNAPRAPIEINRNQHEHVDLIVNQGCQIQIIDQYSHKTSTHEKSSFFHQMSTNIIVHPEARVDYISIVNPGSWPVQILPRTCFAPRSLTVSSDARVRLIDVFIGSVIDDDAVEHAPRSREKTTWHNETIRSQTVGQLIGKGASLENHALFFGTNTNVLDFSTEIQHMAPHTTSELCIKGVLDGHAQALIHALTKIFSHVYACRARQKQDTLLLSNSCEVSPMPSFEILNDDVQCSHSASTGHIDDEKLFYLMSRGLSKSQATQEIARGFLKSIISKINIPSLEKNLYDDLSRLLKTPARPKTITRTQISSMTKRKTHAPHTL